MPVVGGVEVGVEVGVGVGCSKNIVIESKQTTIPFQISNCDWKHEHSCSLHSVLTNYDSCTSQEGAHDDVGLRRGRGHTQ